MAKKTNLLFVAIVLGLGWAMRGHFGLRKTTDFPGRNTRDETWKRWGVILITLLIIFVIITTISIHIHPEMSGAHDRF